MSWFLLSISLAIECDVLKYRVSSCLDRFCCLLQYVTPLPEGRPRPSLLFFINYEDLHVTQMVLEASTFSAEEGYGCAVWKQKAGTFELGLPELNPDYWHQLGGLSCG